MPRMYLKSRPVVLCQLVLKLSSSVVGGRWSCSALASVGLQTPKSPSLGPAHKDHREAAVLHTTAPSLPDGFGSQYYNCIRFLQVLPLEESEQGGCPTVGSFREFGVHGIQMFAVQSSSHR